MGITASMDSVFDNCTEKELDFDTMFDQEDSLIDTVNGVNESGDPLTGVDFAELHQTDDDATPKDVADELGEGHDTKNGSPDPEGADEEKSEDNSVKGEVGKESEADKFTKDADENYQKNGNEDGPKPDAGEVDETIDKAVGEGVDIDTVLDEAQEGRDIDSVLDEAGETGADADVEAMVDADSSLDDADIDKVLDADAKGQDAPAGLEYQLSDEDLIDMAMNGTE